MGWKLGILITGAQHVVQGGTAVGDLPSSPSFSLPMLSLRTFAFLNQCMKGPVLISGAHAWETVGLLCKSPPLNLILQSPPQSCTSHLSISLPAFWGICHRFEKQTGHLGREGAAVLPPWAWSIRSSHSHTLPSPNKQLFNKVCK